VARLAGASLVSRVVTRSARQDRVENEGRNRGLGPQRRDRLAHCGGPFHRLNGNRPCGPPESRSREVRQERLQRRSRAARIGSSSIERREYL
jgi:hypothetical protein